MCLNFTMVNAAGRTQKADTVLYNTSHKKDKNYLKPNLRVSLPAMKPYVISSGKASNLQADDKLLSNVQVYPNPVTDQINIKYTISRNANVNIKIMDILGNPVATIFSQRVDPGEQKFTHNLTNKLQTGFYFIRVVVGPESIIKRISIL